MTCPNCGTYNDPGSRFCLKCGTPLTTTAPTVAPPQPTPIRPPTTPQPAAYSPPPTYAPQQFGAGGASAVGLWGPFAGYGARRRHVGWLMDGEGHRAVDLASSVETKFKEREIPQARVFKTTLVGQGVLVERRPYFVLRRGLASLALYITQFGRDLFISQASYLKPPISAFRVILALASAAFFLFMTFIYPFMWSASARSITESFSLFGGGPSDFQVSTLVFLSCVLGPLGGLNTLLLFILLCFSAYKFLTEKDFFAALRVPPNEFNEDDLMAMEKAVEETVRLSLTDLKLNPDELKMTTAERGRQLF